MQCKSCTADVPPQWKHSIHVANACPSCGAELMSAEDMSLLTEIREAMKQMPADPEGLAGWLLSNYKLEKFGKAEPTEFYQKKQTIPNEGPVLGTDQQAGGEKLISKFMKRTGIKQDTAKFKELVRHIKSGEVEQLDIDIQDSDDEEVQIQASEGMMPDDVEDRIPELKKQNSKVRGLKDEMAISGSVGKISRS